MGPHETFVSHDIVWFRVRAARGYTVSMEALGWFSIACWRFKHSEASRLQYPNAYVLQRREFPVTI